MAKSKTREARAVNGKSASGSRINVPRKGTGAYRKATGSNRPVGTRAKTKYKTRSRAKKGGGYVGIVIVALILGVGVVSAPKIIDHFKKLEKERSSISTRSSSEDDSVEFEFRSNGKGGGAKATRGGFEYKVLYDSAVKKVGELDFEEAGKLFEKAAQQSAASSSIARAKSGAAACELFVDLVKKTPRLSNSPLDAAEKLEVEKIKSERDGVEYCLLAKRAISWGLVGEGKKLLGESFTLDKNIAASYNEYQAGKLYQIGIWFHSRKREKEAKRVFGQILSRYPKTRAARLAKEALSESGDGQALALNTISKSFDDDDEEEEDSTPARPPVKATGSANDMIKKADQHYAAALKLFNEGKEVRSARKSNKLYKKALKEFEASLYLLNCAKKAKPANTAVIEQKIQTTMRMKYWAKKLTRL